MSDFLRQVDEDLRKERLSKLWSKYGLYIILSMIIIVASVIGYQLKVYLDKSNNEKLLETYINALNNESIEQQTAMFESLTNSNNDYLSGMSAIKAANLLIERGNIEEGIIELDKIIKNEKYDTIMRDLATYLLLMHNINSLSEDEFLNYISKQQIEESKFRFLFRELISIKKLLLGKNEDSIREFQLLINITDVPKEVKTRAMKFIQIAN